MITLDITQGDLYYILEKQFRGKGISCNPAGQVWIDTKIGYNHPHHRIPIDTAECAMLSEIVELALAIRSEGGKLKFDFNSCRFASGWPTVCTFNVVG